MHHKFIIAAIHQNGKFVAFEKDSEDVHARYYKKFEDAKLKALRDQQRELRNADCRWRK